MRKLIVSLIAIIMITGIIFAGDLYTRNFDLAPESSKRFLREFAERTNVTVQISSGDLGSGRIIAEVYDPNGKKVASGSKRFSFNTKRLKGKYKIVVINGTKKRQKVKVSINESAS